MMPMVAVAKEAATEMTAAVMVMEMVMVGVAMIMAEAMVVAAATVVVVATELADMVMLDMAAVADELLITICHAIRPIAFIFPV